MNSLEVNNLKECGAINIIFMEILSSSKGQDSFFLKPFRGKKRNRANELVKGNLLVFFQVAKKESHLILTDTFLALKNNQSTENKHFEKLLTGS